MPKITISEEDLTISNEVDIVANVVYVPGMTTKDVDLKPRLFTSVNKFKEAYGEGEEYKAHKFTYPQLVDGVTIVGEGEYEKSYIYALELLNAGTPIYFQNIVKIDPTNDSPSLQLFYNRLRSIPSMSEGEYTFTDENTLVEVGNYQSATSTWETATTGFPYNLRKSADFTYEALGQIPYDENGDAILGLVPGNIFTARLTQKDDEGQIIPKNADMTCTVTVNNGTTTGTTNSYGKEAFEDNGSLVIVVNVKKSTLIKVDVKWAEGIENSYVFKIGTAQLQTSLGETPTENDTYSIYSEILDKWTYNVKFLTTGGYPTMLNTTTDFEVFQTIIKAAAVRGDSVALVDIPYDEDIYEAFTNIQANVDITDTSTYTLKGNNKCNLNFNLNPKRKDENILKYSAIFGPLGIYTVYATDVKLTSDDNNNIKLPGSFGYLLGFANNIEKLTNPDYLAIAGVTRGLVPHLEKLVFETTGAQADAVQVRPVGDDGKDVMSLNPIIYVQNYGYCIWGNRTLFPNPKKDLAASSFLNIRVMSADVKKVIYAACQKLTFETNNIELWLKFKAEVEPILEKMIANGALERYELTKLATTEKATLSVYVKLVTLYAVEDFDITVGLTDSTVEEAE